MRSRGMFGRASLELLFRRRGEVRLADLRDNVHELLIDVLWRRPVTVVVEVDLHQRLRVLAQADENAEDQRLLPDGRVSHLKNRDEDLVHENLNLFLKVSSIRCTDKLTLRGARIDFRMHQKISVDSSNTWFTGETALRDRL